jgi:hypothetical protein
MEQTNIIHEVFSYLVPLIIGVTIVICLTIVIISFLKSLKQKASLQTKTELYSRIIDKFWASPDFFAFLQSEEGRNFIEEDITRSASPLSKILLSIQIGVILILFGAGLLALANIWDSTLGGDLFIILTVTGTIGAMVGAGFIISSVISYKLSKRWGLLTEKEKSPTEKEESPEK